MKLFFQLLSVVRSVGGARAAARKAASIYRKIQTTLENTRTAEIQELRQRAEAGDRNAQYELGESYYTGANVPVDYAEAARWFERAATHGHIKAQSTLAMLYAAGRGVERDLARALHWAEKARKDPAAGKLRTKLLARITAEQKRAQSQPSAHEPEQ